MSKQRKKEPQKKDDGIVYEQTSFLRIDDNTILEQVYNPETKKSMFILASSEKRYHHNNIGMLRWKYTDRYVTPGITYIPLDDGAAQQGAIKLPTQPKPFTDTKDLLKEIRSFIYKYCDVSKDFLTFSSWYVLLSWVYDKLNTIPYLRLQGDTGTGKTRIQQTVGGLCYKPCFVGGAVTPAPIFRLISRWKGTLIIDEADFGKTDESQDIIKILNCGFQKGTPVIRCNQNDADKLQFFDVFCPKLIGTRRSFTDKALESRCLTEITQVTSRKDIPPDVAKDFFDEQESLRNKLLSWRLSQWFKIDSKKNNGIDLGDLEPRLRQATGSFASLFSNIPDVLDNFKKFLKEYQKELISERSQSWDGQIVNAIGNLLLQGNQLINSSDIAEEMKKEGYESTAVSIGRRLKSLSIVTDVKRIGGQTKRILKINNGFIKLFKRYVDNPDTLKNLVTVVTDVTDITDTEGGVTKNQKKEVSVTEGGSPHSTVTTVTSVTQNRIKPADVVACLDPDDIYPIDLLYTTYTEKLINHLITTGELYRISPDKVKVLK